MGRTTEANERYLAAESSSIEGEKAGDPPCTKLRAQSRMVKGRLVDPGAPVPRARRSSTRTRSLSPPQRAIRAWCSTATGSLRFPTSRADYLTSLGSRGWTASVTPSNSTMKRAKPRRSLTWGDPDAPSPSGLSMCSSSLRIEREMVSLGGSYRSAPRPTPPRLSPRGSMTIMCKHLDPLIGIDTHIILIPTPAGPVPTPLPHPYVGMVLDLMDYVPIMGATTYINSLPRGQAGRAVKRSRRTFRWVALS